MDHVHKEKTGDEATRQPRYYWCNGLPLAEGAVVLPGNWGRMMKLYTPKQGNPWALAEELLF